MQRFIINTISFLLLLAVLYQVKPLYLILTDQYKFTVAGAEIYHSIFKSKQKRKTKKLLLGDSLGNQLFSNISTNDTINSLACNQAIGMVGHFLLLNNYLQAGNQLDTVYLFFSPFSFSNNLDQVYSFHYFLKPFYTKEYQPYFTENVRKQIHKIPYWYLCRIPSILTSNWAPDYILKDETDNTFLSPISAEYLVKIKKLSIRYNFKIVIITPPTRVSMKSFFDKMDKQRILNNNLSEEFKDYFENILYIDDNNFIDPVHLKNPTAFKNYYRNLFVR